MKDVYKYDSDGVFSVIMALKEVKSSYNDEVVSLKALVDNINSSSAWKDVDIKTSFIDTCNSYIKIYNNFLQVMDIYIDYLSKKSDVASSIETTYSGGVYE